MLRIGLMSFLCMFLSVPVCFGQKPLDIYEDVILELESEGYRRAYLEDLFFSPRIENYPRIMNIFAAGRRMEQDSTYNPYLKFLTAASVNRGIEFYNRNASTLSAAQNRYGVEAETIVAILRVESAFGENTGEYQAFGVYASIVRYGSGDKRRVSWAKKELIALVRAADEMARDPLAVMSSYAGALGPPQFLPSSYLAYAVDGDGNGAVDIFNMEDAIFSIAHYLSENGWRSDSRKAILAYNRSTKYADSIQAYAESLRSRP